jgi:hypothetical protein
MTTRCCQFDTFLRIIKALAKRWGATSDSNAATISQFLASSSYGFPFALRLLLPELRIGVQPLHGLACSRRLLLLTNEILIPTKTFEYPLNPIGGNGMAPVFSFFFSSFIISFDGSAPFPHSHCCYPKLTSDVFSRGNAYSPDLSTTLFCLRFLSWITLDWQSLLAIFRQCNGILL